MQKTCTQCTRMFEVTGDDHALYARIGVPDPKICVTCSEKARLCFRNERTYYRRKCDATGKDIVSIYAPDGPYKVFHREAWFSDMYDPTAYGRDVNFTRPIFEQMRELSLAVPYEHMVIMNSTNCDYCNFIVNSKDCYLSQRILGENVYYSYLAIGYSKDCFDCYRINACELCYECLDSGNCYTCSFCRNCRQCVDCALCIDCTGCKNCFGCVALVQKEYCFFNEQLDTATYAERIREWQRGSHVERERQIQALAAHRLKFPHKYSTINLSENASGDYIIQARNVSNSYEVDEGEDITDCWGIEYGKDTARSSHSYYPELCYELLSCATGQNIRYCYGVYSSHDLEYCIMSHNGSHDCFASIGLKHNSFCILNKQYTEEAYRDLKTKVVEYMRSTGEYGRFFPSDISPFAYNETIAHEQFPLTRDEAVVAGYRWRDEPAIPGSATGAIRAQDLPDTIDEVKDDIVSASVICEATGKPFRILKQELEFYRKRRLPLPRVRPEERHQRRRGLRNPRQLWERQCAKCAKPISTTYAPERPEIVFCEECYLKEVY